MKWFRHNSDSNSDMGLEAIIENFGMEGYGLYWLCCELVAHQGENYRIKSAKGWQKAIKKRSKLSKEILLKILKEFSTIDLINEKAYNQNDLYMPKMKKYSDDYTKRVRRVSEQSSEKVPLQYNTIHNNTYIYWNSKKIVVHKKLTDKMKTKINSVLKEYNEKDIRKAIDNYAIVLEPEIEDEKNKKYFWTYKWTLDEFMARGFTKFLETPVSNFLKKNQPEVNKLTVNNPKWKNL